jgi:hypothetical protein
MSTASCSAVVDEVISYYKNSNTPVFCVMLDASKAFDCGHFVMLLRLLLRKGYHYVHYSKNMRQVGRLLFPSVQRVKRSLKV